MLTWVTIFLIVSIVAGLYGFGGYASFTAQAAKLSFFFFSTLFVISLIYSFLPEPKSQGNEIGKKKKVSVIFFKEESVTDVKG